MTDAPSALSLLPFSTGGPGCLAPEDWGRAFSQALQIQIRAYGRILLPHLGRGQRRHLPERKYRLAGRILEAPRETMWVFDGDKNAGWFDIAVNYQMENIDDWFIIFRPCDVPRSICETLRPPLVPGLRKTLSALPWSVVDVCATGEGNLESTDFLEIIDHYPWLRVDHRTDAGIFCVEDWRDRERKERLELELDVQLLTDISADYPAPDSPLLIDPDWNGPEDDRLLVPVADTLDDIYATLRRLVDHRFGLDIDRIGPLLFWRDWPDELFEFDEREDPDLVDISTQMAAILNRKTDEIAPLVDAWLARCISVPRCVMPYLGELRSTALPDLQLEFPDEDREPIAIPGRPLYVAVTSAGQDRSG